MLGTLLGAVSFTATGFQPGGFRVWACKNRRMLSIGFPKTTKIDEPPTRSQSPLLNRTRVSFRGLRHRAREQEIEKQQGRASGTHF